MNDERYCTNCRALIPAGANTCPACGVYAGDVFDGRLPKASGKRRAASGWLFVFLIVIAAAGAGWWYLNRSAVPRPDSGPIRVVGDRPGGARRPAGAKINEAEAVLTLRHYFASQPQPVKSKCIAVIGHGYRDGYYSFDAVDSCARTKLGRWRVDAKTGAVTSASG
jgi:hypothetical protein